MSYSIFNRHLDFVWKCCFLLLMKADITRKKIDLPRLFFVNHVRASTSNSLVKSKTVKIYWVVQNVKLLLVLSIYYIR